VSTERIEDDARRERIDALRATLTTPEAVDAFSLDIDDRVSALYFELVERYPEHVREIARRLADVRTGASAATRACGIR
jgi:hypothetical protein